MKKLRVMVDINVILDVLENRNGWVMDAAKTCAVCGGGMRAIGFVPPHAVTTIYYIVRKRGGKALADKAIDWLLALFKVADCGTDEFKAARASGIDDYEDAVVVASAQKTGCDYIVTRNMVHFKGSSVPVISPADFAAKFGGGLWKSLF